MPKSATIEAVGGRLVVWSVRHDTGGGEWNGRVMACRRSDGARALVTITESDYETFEAYQFVAAGRWIAYVDSYHGRGIFESVLVRDPFAVPRSRPPLVEAPFTTEFAHNFPRAPSEGDNDVLALVLTRSGGIAYLVRHRSDTDASGRPHARVELRAAVRAERRLLDTGEGIDPGSLRLAGSVVHWTNAGEARSAAIH